MATYVVVQVVIITLNIRAAFVSNLSPLASMGKHVFVHVFVFIVTFSGMTLFVLVIHLKLHSYVVTNTILNSLIREKFSKYSPYAKKKKCFHDSSITAECKRRASSACSGETAPCTTTATRSRRTPSTSAASRHFPTMSHSAVMALFV